MAIWRTVRKHWLVAVVLIALAGAGTAFYTLGLTKIYEARATIMFDPDVPRPLGDQKSGAVGDISSYWNNKEYYNTQHWMIRSMRIAQQVVKDLDLNRDRAFLQNLPTSSDRGRGQASIEDAALVLIKRTKVEPIRESRLTSVTYRDADPVRAQRVLNALVDAYAAYNLDDVFESATTAADWLRGQVGSLRHDLETSELALHQFKKDRNILSVSMDDQSNMLRGEMTQLGQALTEVRAHRERTMARLKELQKISADDPSALPAKELIESAALANLRAQYVETSRELTSLAAEGRGENHPQVKAALARRDTVRAALLAEVKNIQESCARDAAALEREIAGLKGLYDAAEKRALDLNLMEIEYDRLRRAKDTNEKLFSLVIERSKETDLTRLLRINNVRVVDRPLLPRTPVTPNVPLNIAIGLAAGALLALATALAREQLDRTLKAPEEVEKVLGSTLLGVLPDAPDDMPTRPKRGRRRARTETGDSAKVPLELTVHRRPTSGLAEAVRAIRTNLVFMSPDNPHRTLLITSAAPSEGKTTVACALAITIAQAGHRVALVDCDLRRPRLHSVFSNSNDFGVTSALLDRDTQDSIAVPTEVPNLWVVPTGPIPPNPAELLHSEAFRSILNRLKERFDRIVIDSPPIAPVTDATVLSTQVDGVVVVVRASRTPKDLVRRALRSLRDVGSHVVGVVLNAADVEGESYRAYRYYSYRREGYYSLATPPERSEHIGSA